jgi:hypothetical protein
METRALSDSNGVDYDKLDASLCGTVEGMVKLSPISFLARGSYARRGLGRLSDIDLIVVSGQALPSEELRELERQITENVPKRYSICLKNPVPADLGFKLTESLEFDGFLFEQFSHVGFLLDVSHTGLCLFERRIYLTPILEQFRHYLEYCKEDIHKVIYSLNRYYCAQYAITAQTRLLENGDKYITNNVYGQLFKSILRCCYFKYFDRYRTYNFSSEKMLEACSEFSSSDDLKKLRWILNALQCDYIDRDDLGAIIMWSYQFKVDDSTLTQATYAMKSLNDKMKSL